MIHSSYAVIDTETTSLDPDTDRIVSVAIVPVTSGAPGLGMEKLESFRSADLCSRTLTVRQTPRCVRS